ncbi:PucR C-terminal helix-turn-helix domain-containing protein [Lentibacillus persicus]|uniref:PucR C-terminal helix-turn-helix domain-containing protein n=1 Tax=Lentibacillus persicus TaxID=640948 RepID=A0A1I1YWG4_9BACI|nr:XylR N-terminal domain-containing protein [Lentibacillus persicus]SFE23935.1 PucR C-terminal helix-turn-helix domain-containing protein [Lentibacillus persicus]
MEIKREDTKLTDIFELPKDEALKTFYERMITIPITAIESLKQELTTMVGEERSKGIFIRYGWHNGVSDGQTAKTFQWESERDLINAGPELHMLHGYLDYVRIDDIDYDEAGDLASIDVSWFNSFEVEKFLKSENYSEEPICHTLCGYASGYLSTVLERPILVKETKCRAMGYDHCEVVCIPMEKWGDELENEYHYYQSTSMIQELDEVTAKLKVERDHLNKTYEIHRRLIKELLSKQGLQRIVNVLYQSTGRPIFIENEDHKLMAKSDEVTVDFDLEDLNTDTTNFIKLSEDTGLLRTPIYLEQQIKGYCTFLFENGSTPNNLEYMIIDQASITSSIILLNENIKINTEQNIRRGFLSDILDGRMDQEELYKTAYYLNFNPNDSYWMLTIERENENPDMSRKIEVNEALINHINSLLRERYINAIVSQKSGKIIVLIDHASFKEVYVNQLRFIKQLIKDCSRRFSKQAFYAGVSSCVQTIDQVPALYDETLAALKARNPNEKVHYFEDLGIESLLFQIPDETLINRFVDKQVGELLEVDKNDDLIQTFYAYVENGVNINNTAKAISMSISGLRYRLSKISETLDIDLDDTKSVFSVYMALNVLKAKGRISI